MTAESPDVIQLSDANLVEPERIGQAIQLMPGAEAQQRSTALRERIRLYLQQQRESVAATARKEATRAAAATSVAFLRAANEGAVAFFSVAHPASAGVLQVRSGNEHDEPATFTRTLLEVISRESSLDSQALASALQQVLHHHQASEQAHADAVTAERQSVLEVEREKLRLQSTTAACKQFICENTTPDHPAFVATRRVVHRTPMPPEVKAARKKARDEARKALAAAEAQLKAASSAQPPAR